MEVHQRAMRAEREDLELVRSCFEAHGGPRSMEGLEWQYRDNPVGRLWAELALPHEPGGTARLAALYATLPLHVRVGGRRRVALQSLDTITDHEFRGRGLFHRLARTTFERAVDDDVAFVFGFPNGNSAPGFFGKLEWQSLDPLPFLIRPLRTGYIASRLGLKRIVPWLPDLRLSLKRHATSPGGRPVEVERFDERFTRLWSSFSDSVGVAVDRDSAYLNWRLVDKPGCDYRRLAIMDRDEPVAFVAYCSNEKHGGKVGTILELLHAPGRRAEARRLLAGAVSELSDDGADVVLAWCLPRSPNFSCYLRSGFLPFPVSLRPIELHFGVRAFDPSVAALVENRANWYVSYLDSDTT